jgi:hypothetical protein
MTAAALPQARVARTARSAARRAGAGVWAAVVAAAPLVLLGALLAIALIAGFGLFGAPHLVYQLVLMRL